jgi:tetratricopeptide (TPR) repeat protein
VRRPRAYRRKATSIRPGIERRLAALAAALALGLALAGCLSPYAQLALALLPEGTFTTLLNNLRGVSETNREKLAELERKGDWQAMAQFAQQNIAKDPTHADWWVVAGFAYAQLGEFQRAADSFQEAVRLSPDDIDAWNLLGQSYRAMKQPERAIRTLNNALQINKDSPVTYYLIGESYNELKRPDRAITYYELALQRNPQFVEALYSAGFTYAALGRKRELDATVARMRALSPPHAERLAAVQVRPPAAAAPAGGASAPGVPDLPVERRSPRD